MEYWKNLALTDIIYINDNGLVSYEEWRDIPKYEDNYQVSNLGRVKSKAMGKGRCKKEFIRKQDTLNNYLRIEQAYSDIERNSYGNSI